MINKKQDVFQCNSGNFSLYNFTTHKVHCAQLPRKVMIKYVGPVVIYKIIDPHNYLFMTLDGEIQRGLFKHERLKLANIRTDQGNIQNLAQLKQVINVGFKI